MNDEPTPEEKNAVYEEAHLHNAVASVLPLLREMPEALDLLRRLVDLHRPDLSTYDEIGVETQLVAEQARKLIRRVEGV
jgi:hypothetical protein